MSKTIALIATPGSVGELVAPLLALRPGVEVRALVGTAAGPAVEGIESHPGELSDGDFLTAATAGVDSLLWFTPMACGGGDDPLAWHRQLGTLAHAAIESNGIPHVVHVSSLGAGGQAAGRALRALTLVEDILETSCADVTQVRAAWSMENLGCQLDAICQTATLFLPVSGVARVPMVSGADLAEVLASLLLAEPKACTCLVAGPDHQDFDEAALAIGRGMGRELKHVEVPVAQVKQALVAAGACRWGAELLSEMAAFSETPDEAVGPGQIHFNTKTSLETFARDTLAPLVASCGN